MQSVLIPNCCGVILLENFGHTSSNGLDFKNEFKPSEEEVFDYLEKQKHFSKSRMLVAFLNDDQYKVLKGVFKKAGFKRSNSFYYVGHRKNIYQFTFINKNIKIKNK